MCSSSCRKNHPNRVNVSRSRTTSGGNDGWPNCVNSRAEKSRNAAKMRRDKESEEITALSKLLPYPDEVTARLDKGSVIRLATSFLRMKKFSKRDGDALLEELKDTLPDNEDSSGKELQVPGCNDGTVMMQAWNGFLIFISRKGQIYYISENATKHLGIHQYDMLGKSVLDFIHPDDHKELAKQFMVSVPGQQTFKGYGMEGTKDRPTAMSVNFFNQTDEEYVSVSDFVQERSFFLRMRSVMSKKSSSGKGKVVGYRVVNYTGRLKLKSSPNNAGFTVEGLICLCRPIQPLPVVEIRMDGNMFMSRHGMDMSFTFCDPRIITLIGYEPHELIGKTAYQFHNPLDASKVSDCHSKLIVKGSSMSKHYRFLGKAGAWVWMRTKATIIYNTSGVAQYVVAMNYVIGKEEGERMMMLERMQEAIESPGCSDAEACQSADSSRGSSPALDSNRPCQPLLAEEVSHFIPKVIQEHPILKPVGASIDFSSLVPESAPPRAPPVEVMDVTDLPGSQPGAQFPRTEASSSISKASLPPAPSKLSQSHMFQAELSKSDSPQSDLESVSSGSVCSPPVPTVSHDMSGGGDRGTDSFSEVFPSRSPLMDAGAPLPLSSLSAVPSPAYNSPGSFQDSPSPTSAGTSTLEELMESDLLQEDAPDQDRAQKRMFLGVTDLTGLNQSLPEGLTEFSLEFFNNLLDQSAQDAAAELGQDLGLNDMSEVLENDSIQPPQNSAVITELPEDPSPPVTTTQSVPLDPPLTESNHSYPSNGTKPEVYHLQGQYSSSTGEDTSQSSMLGDPSMSHNMADSLSKLEIKDTRMSTGSPANQSTKSLLKALLTGRGATPQAREVSGMNQGMGGPGSQGYYSGPDLQVPPGMVINNNTLHQRDDFGLLERQQQQILFEQRQRQQQAYQMAQDQLRAQILEQQLYQQQGGMGYTPQGPMVNIPQENYGMQEMPSPQHIGNMSLNRSLNGAGMPPHSINYSSNNYQMNGGVCDTLRMNESIGQLPPQGVGTVINGGPHCVSPQMRLSIQNGSPIAQNGGLSNVPVTMTAPQLSQNGMPLNNMMNMQQVHNSGNDPWARSRPIHQYHSPGKSFNNGPQPDDQYRVHVPPYI